MNNKVLFVFLFLLLLLADSLVAQNKIDIIVKSSHQDETIRIVFESDESYISRAKITTSISSIKTEFPGIFNLVAQKTPLFDLKKEDTSLLINLKEKSEIKIFKLPSPSRIVFDIKKKGEITDRSTTEKTEKLTDQQTAKIHSRVFVIDAGHGGYDFGIIYGEMSEKDITLDIARDIGSMLSKMGKKVFFIRKVDQYVSLADRINVVNQKKPDIFISFHASMTNSFFIYSPSVETEQLQETVAKFSLAAKQLKYSARSQRLSDSIGKIIKEELNFDVIQRSMPLPILNSVEAPCVLIEVPSPRFTAYDEQMKTKLIDAVMNSISLYE
jgi:N-acetylmuramoyl-L-alanine amidase